MLHNNDIARILKARSNSALDNVPVPVMFGKLLLELKSPCPNFEQLLIRKYSLTVRASLVSLFDPYKHDVVSDYLKFEDGENVSHVAVSMDYRLETSEARKAFRALFRNSAKAFLTYECRGNGENPVIFLELWALEKLCEFHDPSEITKRTSLVTHCNNMVEVLYPEMVAEQQESLISEGENNDLS